MANTKNIEDTNTRKTAKRKLRRALKGFYGALSTKQKKQFRNSETVGVRKWSDEQKAIVEA